MWRRAIFLLLIASQSSTKVHLSADACSLDSPGGTPGNYWWGCAAPFSKSLPYFRPQNVIFRTRFQTWPLGTYFISNNNYIRKSNKKDFLKAISNLFPSSPGFPYQNEVKCSAFDMKMILHSHANKTHFH